MVKSANIKKFSDISAGHLSFGLCQSPQSFLMFEDNWDMFMSFGTMFWDDITVFWNEIYINKLLIGPKQVYFSQLHKNHNLFPSQNNAPKYRSKRT